MLFGLWAAPTATTVINVLTSCFRTRHTLAGGGWAASTAFSPTRLRPVADAFGRGPSTGNQDVSEQRAGPGG